MSLRFDRARAATFVRFLWRRFLDDRCPETAGALSFTTLFALVPLTAAILGILSTFPVFEAWRARLTDFVFQNFVPATGTVVQGYLTQFADNASKATVIGVLVLLFSAIMLMSSIEDAYNRIWRVPTARGMLGRFLLYWAALSLGPLLLVAALAISSYVFALPLLDRAASEYALKARLLGVLPFLMTWLGLTASYVVIPNRRTPLRYALWGSLVAALLFEGAKYAFALYVRQVPSYEQVYGTLAVVPIFLLWMYLSWIIVLLGASLAASFSAFDYRRAAARLPPGQEFFGLLRVLRLFAVAQRDGRGLHSEELRRRETFLSDDLLQRYLGELNHAKLIQRAESGEWLLTRNLDGVSLLALYEAGGYRLPLDAAAAALAQGELAAPLRERLARLGAALRAGLDVPLAEIFPPVPPSNPSVNTDSRASS